MPLFDDIWNPVIQTSISIFMWRLLSNRIPVDAKMQWRKISLASKCQCCACHPRAETIQHLFIQGEAARLVWDKFDSWFIGDLQRLSLMDTIPDRMGLWARRTGYSDPSHVCRLIPCLILWFLWVERNNSRHNEEAFSEHHVVWQVQNYLRHLTVSGALESSKWTGVEPDVSLGQSITVKRPRQLIIPVKWEPPDEGWVKLNIAGCPGSGDGRACGGGVIRDSRGELLTAFGFPSQSNDPLEIEINATARGLELAKAFDRPIWIEVSAMQLVGIVSSKEHGPARVRHAMSSLRGFLKNTHYKVSHIRKEGNKAAGELAKLGLESADPFMLDPNTTPRRILSLIRMDQLGLPNFAFR